MVISKNAARVCGDEVPCFQNATGVFDEDQGGINPCAMRDEMMGKSQDELLEMSYCANFVIVVVMAMRWGWLLLFV